MGMGMGMAQFARSLFDEWRLSTQVEAVEGTQR